MGAETLNCNRCRTVWKQIGDEAFYGCERLELQSLPKGLTQIGNSAFWGCKSLALQSLPENPNPN